MLQYTCNNPEKFNAKILNKIKTEIWKNIILCHALDRHVTCLY